MTKKPLVFCVDALPPEIRASIADQKPESLDLVFVETSAEAERVSRAREADYLLCSWTPVSGQVIEAGKKLKLIQKI